MLSTLKDPAVVVLADWLKVRGSLKGWTKLWCVLKPGMLLLYKSAKVKVGTDVAALRGLDSLLFLHLCWLQFLPVVLLHIVVSLLFPSLL